MTHGPGDDRRALKKGLAWCVLAVALVVLSPVSAHTGLPMTMGGLLLSLSGTVCFAVGWVTLCVGLVRAFRTPAHRRALSIAAGVATLLLAWWVSTISSGDSPGELVKTAFAVFGLYWPLIAGAVTLMSLPPKEG
jgi:hypothetical protein